MNKKFMILMIIVAAVFLGGVALLINDKNEQSGGQSQPDTPNGQNNLVSGSPWVWQGATYQDGSNIKPDEPDQFILVFEDGGQFSSTTDCNNVGGSYTLDGDKLTFGEMRSTLMFCEGSQEQQYMAILADTQSYSFNSQGDLELKLKTNVGVATFSNN